MGALCSMAAAVLACGISLSACQQAAHKPVTAEQAEAIARNECIAKGWDTAKIFPAEQDGTYWTVVVERDPTVYGAHALIEVPIDGGKPRFLGGS